VFQTATGSAPQQWFVGGVVHGRGPVGAGKKLCWFLYFFQMSIGLYIRDSYFFFQFFVFTFFNFVCSLFSTLCVHFLFFFKSFQQLTTALSQEGHDTVSDLVELSSLLEEVRQQEDFVLEERKENEKIRKKVDAAMSDIEGT
jgi:hypothetical protein